MERSLQGETQRQLDMLQSAIAHGDRKEAAQRLDAVQREPVYQRLFFDARFWHAASLIHLMNGRPEEARHCNAQTHGDSMHHYDDGMQTRYMRHLFRRHVTVGNTSAASHVLDELEGAADVDPGWLMMSRGRVEHMKLRSRAFITRGTKSRLVEEILDYYDQADQYWLTHPPTANERWHVTCLMARFDALLELPHHSATREIQQVERTIVSLDESLRKPLKRKRHRRRLLG